MTLNDSNIGGPPGAEERDPRLDRLYRETERAAPPAHLDAALLAAARREVGARPRPLSSALRRWRVPVSIAALVVLSVSLVTLVREEGGDELMKVAPGTPPAPKPSETAPPPAPQPAQADAARPSLPAPAARPEPARPAPRDDRRADAPVELGAMADRPQRDSVTAVASGAGTAAAPEPAAKPSPQPFLAVPRVEERAAVLPQAAPAMEDGAMRAPAARSSIRSAVRGQDQAPPWQGYEKEPPQKWLDRIVELRRQGETAAAGEMLAEFKRRFPDHPVPPDLGTR
jgi:hypothetical protein